MTIELLGILVPGLPEESSGSKVKGGGGSGVITAGNRRTAAAAATAVATAAQCDGPVSDDATDGSSGGRVVASGDGSLTSISAAQEYGSADHCPPIFALDSLAFDTSLFFDT